MCKLSINLCIVFKIHWTSLLLFCNIQKSLEYLWKSLPMSAIDVNVSGNPGDRKRGGGGGGEYHTFDTDGKLTQLGYDLFR